MIGRLPDIRLLLAALALLLAACDDLAMGNAGGGGNGDPTHLRGTVHAIGLAWESIPGESSTADLLTIRIASGDANWLDGVYGPELALGDSLTPFFGTSAGGVFATDTRRGQWQLTPGRQLRFLFNHVDEEGRHSEFEAAVRTPDQRHTIEVSPTQLLLIAGEPVLLDVAGLLDGAWVRVFHTEGAETPTFSSFGIAQPGDAVLALDNLRAWALAELVVPADAFPVPGRYRIEIINFRITDRSDTQVITENHGSHSFYAAGLLSFVEVELN